MLDLFSARQIKKVAQIAIGPRVLQAFYVL